MSVRVVDLPPEPIVDADAMLRLGRYVARQLGPGDVLALVGELGAGKTTFVKGLAAGLGIDSDAVASPTFGLVHQYGGGEIPLVHADLYRLTSRAEAEAAGIGDLLHDPESIVAVEWPWHARGLLPRHAVWLEFSLVGEPLGSEGRSVVQVLAPA